jgi:signal transduction histidine kinase
MLPEFARRNIRLETQLDNSLVEMDLDPNLLYRAFLNLFLNAAQAMPEGGTITLISTPSPAAKNGVVVTIQDTGIGIPEDKKGLIFTPFYTDKNRGTGLGLAIAKNIIEGHNGTITVDSEIGQGSTFTITLATE